MGGGRGCLAGSNETKANSAHVGLNWGLAGLSLAICHILPFILWMQHDHLEGKRFIWDLNASFVVILLVYNSLDFNIFQYWNGTKLSSQTFDNGCDSKQMPKYVTCSMTRCLELSNLPQFASP